MNTMKLFQRRQLVVDPKFQYSLIARFVVLESIVLIVSLILLAFVFNRFINISLPISADTGGVLSFGANTSIRLSDEIHIVLAVMLLSIVIGTIGMYVFGVSVSHRIAGPVQRLRKYIAAMRSGDLNKEVSFREKDFLKPLATDINSLRRQWHDSIMELHGINNQLYAISNSDQQELLDRSDKILRDLLKNVS